MTSLRQNILLLVKKIAFFTLVSGVILLVGCWDRIEMNDLAIITAAGIDYTDDDQVLLSFQIFNPSAPGAGTQAESGSTGGMLETLVMSHSGENIADALSKLQADLARKTFWGLCKVIIFGEAAAENGIHEHMDFLLRHPEPRERAFAFVSEGEAKKFLELKAELERYSAEYIREISARRAGVGVTLLDLHEMLSNDKGVGLLPYLRIRTEDTREIAAINGTAMFKGDRMIGTVSQSTTRGILWLRNELEDYTIVAKVEDLGEIAIFPVETKVSLTPEIENEEWKMIIKVDAEGTLIQNTTKLNLNDPASLEKANIAFRQKIEERMRIAIREAMDMRIDVIHFGKKFSHKYPKEWKRVKDSWGDEKFQEVKVQFIIDTNIKRKGYIGSPIKGSSK